jgi:bifunctional DNase/RNase
MNKVEVKIEVLSYAKSQVGNYVIVLSELSGNRKLPIIIKTADAQFIAVRMEGIKTPRPMTQDLFKLLTDGYNIDIQEVTIHNVAEGIFYAKISTANMADNLDLECTVGDALSMAVLYSCPIFVSEEVMVSSSVDMNAPAPQSNVVPSKRKVPKKKEKPESIENLNKMLHDALELEDYEAAVELRDKIAKLKKV